MSLPHADDLYHEIGKCHNAELHTAAPTGDHRQRDGIKALLLVTQSTIAACSQCIHSKTGAHAEFQERKMEKPDVVARWHCRPKIGPCEIRACRIVSCWFQLACGSVGLRGSMILPDAQCFGCSRICATVPTTSVVCVLLLAHSNKALVSLSRLTQYSKLLASCRARRYCLSDSYDCGHMHIFHHSKCSPVACRHRSEY